MQITSYDVNLSFFYGWIYNFRDYSIYKAIINVFFALNFKICRILWFTIRSYDLRSHLPSTISRRIPILTILLTNPFKSENSSVHCANMGGLFWSHPFTAFMNVLTFYLVGYSFDEFLLGVLGIWKDSNAWGDNAS